jgi:hypothetical protein
MPDAGRTRSLACKGRKHASKSLQVRPKQSGIPRAMVLAAASYSPRGAGLVSPRHVPVSACRSRQGRHRQTGSLISASGDQDHTTWPSALKPLVWRPQHVHRIPLSTLLTMRSAPLASAGYGRETHVSEKRKRNIFALAAGQGKSG